jgi:hypothetical protein
MSMRSNQKRYDVSQSPFYKLSSRSRLAGLLGITLAELRRFETDGDMYREFDLPKKTGGTRHVENPTPGLKAAQARMATILGRIMPPDFLYCPVKGRCYVSNAAQHIGNRVVRCIDIKKFFPSTPSHRVDWTFRNIFKCPADIAGLLTKVSTYKGHLPTGSPLSPILAYFAFYDLWDRIGEFCREKGYTLTIYVDDITVSGPKVPMKDMWQVQRMIHGAGLRYHKEKGYFDVPAEVTGVIVHPAGVTVPNRQLKKLHTAKKALPSKVGDEALALKAQVLGLRAQISQISKVNQSSMSANERSAATGG